MKVKIKETGEIIEVEVRKDSDTGKTFYVNNETFNAYAEDEVELLEDNSNNGDMFAMPIQNFQKFLSDMSSSDVTTFWKYFRTDIFKICIQQGFDFGKAADAAALATDRLFRDCKAFENKIFNNKNN